MGKRRIRNLLKLGFKDIIGFDATTSRRTETGKKFVPDVTVSGSPFSSAPEEFTQATGFLIGVGLLERTIPS